MDCTYNVRTAMYVHCTYGYVRTLYVRTRTSKKLSFRMLSVPNPDVRACTYNVRTLYVHLPAGIVQRCRNVESSCLDPLASNCSNSAFNLFAITFHL